MIGTGHPQEIGLYFFVYMYICTYSTRHPPVALHRLLTTIILKDWTKCLYLKNISETYTILTKTTPKYILYLINYTHLLQL